MSEQKQPLPFEPGWYRQAAEAATEIGHEDYDRAAPEGFAIAVMAVIGCVFAALVLAHFVAGG